MSIANDGEANLGFPGEQFAELIDTRLEALGRLGLSPVAQQDLREMFVGDAEDDTSIEPYSLALSGLSLLVQARNAAGVTEAPFSGAVHHVSQETQKVVPLHSVATPSLPKTPADTKPSLETLKSEPDISTVTDKTKRFFGLLLNNEDLPTDLTQAQAEAFTEVLFSKYVAVRKTRIDPVMLERQKVGLLQLLKGTPLKVIQEEINAPSVEAVGIFPSQFRNKLVKAYGVDALRGMFKAFIADEEIAGAPLDQSLEHAGLSGEVVMLAATKPEVVISQATPETLSDAGEIDPYEAWLEDIKHLVEPVWKLHDVKGLLELLDNKAGEDVDGARFHLRALMAAYAPLRPVGGTGGANTKWMTMNLLSGYNLQQSEKPLPPRYVIPRMKGAYEKHGVLFTAVFQAALSEYIELAAPEYAKGWYPEQTFAAPQPTITTPSPELPAGAEAIVDGVDTAAHVHQSMTRSVIRLLGRTSGVSVEQLELLVKHLSGETTGLDDQRLLRLTRPLSERTTQIMAQSRRAQSNSRRDVKHIVDPRQVAVLNKLYGSLTAHGAVKPLTIDQIVTQTRQEGNKISRAELIEMVRHTLHTLATH